MKRLWLPLIAAFMTFYWSVFFTQRWQRSRPKPPARVTARLTKRAAIDGAMMMEKIDAAEFRYIQCVSPGTLPRTKEEAEKVRRLCAEERDQAIRAILNEESPR
jgi:hypothetical protein